MTPSPTQKPVGLLSQLLEAEHLPAESWILDGFLGSSSTLIAAEKLGYRCLGIELSPEYAHAVIQRWESYTGQRAESRVRARSHPAMGELHRAASESPQLSPPAARAQQSSCRCPAAPPKKKSPPTQSGALFIFPHFLNKPAHFPNHRGALQLGFVTDTCAGIASWVSDARCDACGCVVTAVAVAAS